jgi:hypothetical protein
MRLPVPPRCNFRGNVEYCLDPPPPEPDVGTEAVKITAFAFGGCGGCCCCRSKITVTTDNLTRSPDLRMRVTTVSWLACLTS